MVRRPDLPQSGAGRRSSVADRSTVIPPEHWTHCHAAATRYHALEVWGVSMQDKSFTEAQAWLPRD